MHDWWLAPTLHPLLLKGQDSPMRWLSPGLGEAFSLGYLPFKEPNPGTFGAWGAALHF